METPVQVAERLGIPATRLERLLEHPKVAKVLVVAREYPDIAPEAIFARENLPVVDPDGLDLDKLELELELTNRLQERGDGSLRSHERIEGSGLMLGRMERAKKETDGVRMVLAHIESLIGVDGEEMPSVTSVNAARKVIKEALEK